SRGRGIETDEQPAGTARRGGMAEHCAAAAAEVEHARRTREARDGFGEKSRPEGLERRVLDGPGLVRRRGPGALPETVPVSGAGGAAGFRHSQALSSASACASKRSRSVRAWLLRSSTDTSHVTRNAAGMEKSAGYCHGNSGSGLPRISTQMVGPSTMRLTESTRPTAPPASAPSVVRPRQ